MRIAYIVKEFPRVSETFILTEILELERLGAEVSVFSRYAATEDVQHAALRNLRADVEILEPLLRDRLWKAFEIHRRLAESAGARHDAGLTSALAHTSREEMRYWLIAARVAERVLAEGFDLIHAHFATGSASVARYASRITGVPFTFTSHAKDIYAVDVDASRLRSLLREASTAVTISDANLKHLQTIAPDARLARVYNGIDLERFLCRPSVASHEGPLIVCVARLVEKKGLPVLMHALALMRERGTVARLRLVGSGPLEPAMRSLAETLGLSDAVRFVGTASQEEIVAKHLAEADVFVQACIVAPDGDRDGVPTTLLEAMAIGVPVVATTLPGLSEAVPPDRAGLLAPPGDAHALAAAIEATLQHPEEARRRALFARRHVARLFDSRTNARALYDVFAHAAASLSRESA